MGENRLRKSKDILQCSVSLISLEYNPFVLSRLEEGGSVWPVCDKVMVPSVVEAVIMLESMDHLFALDGTSGVDVIGTESNTDKALYL